MYMFYNVLRNNAVDLKNSASIESYGQGPLNFVIINTFNKTQQAYPFLVFTELTMHNQIPSLNQQNRESH